MKFYNLDADDQFDPIPLPVAYDEVTRDFFLHLGVAEFDEWASLTDRHHLYRVLTGIHKLFDNPLQLALTGAIVIQLLDTPNLKGALLIGLAGATRSRDWQSLMTDMVDGVRGDIFRYENVNTGELIASERKVDRGLMFDRANGPIVYLSPLEE